MALGYWFVKVMRVDQAGSMLMRSASVGIADG